jgi:hypothetical protein
MTYYQESSMPRFAVLAFFISFLVALPSSAMFSPVIGMSQTRANYEAVLVPVYSSGPGAYGSQWTSVLRIHNSAPAAADFGHLPAFSPPCPLGVPCFASLPPNATVPYAFFPNQPFGLILYPPRSHSGQLHYQLRIRDLSRQLETWGTELPVVHETDFKSTVQLLDVPTSSEFRNSLRIYALSQDTIPVRIRVFSQPEPTVTQPVPHAELLAEEALELVWRPSVDNHPDYPRWPAYAAIHDFAKTYASVEASSLVRIELTAEGSAPIWAFVSVTNNVTQHVTTLTPQSPPN